MPTPATDIDLATAAELAQQLRVDSIRSQHLGRVRASDLQHVRRRPDGRAPGAGTSATTGTSPDHPNNDHLIFSKGHASPLLYAMFKAVGVRHRRRADDRLPPASAAGLRVIPPRVLPWVDVATGSLGQGLPDGVGVALAGKYLDQLPYRVWVLLR